MRLESALGYEARHTVRRARSVLTGISRYAWILDDYVGGFLDPPTFMPAPNSLLIHSEFVSGFTEDSVEFSFDAFALGYALVCSVYLFIGDFARMSAFLDIHELLHAHFFQHTGRWQRCVCLGEGRTRRKEHAENDNA